MKILIVIIENLILIAKAAFEIFTMKENKYFSDEYTEYYQNIFDQISS